MYWPDTNTGVDIEPARKPVASAVRKFFTEGGAGQPPTVPGGDWFNQITNELLNVLAAAGIDPSKADDDQLLQAIQALSIAGLTLEGVLLPAPSWDDVPAYRDGGPSGEMNAQAEVLTARSEWLKAQAGDVVHLSSYAALRAYTGTAKAAMVACRDVIFDGAEGIFSLVTSDSSSADDDGSILVDALGRRWRRNLDAGANPRWWGAKGDGVADDTNPIKSALASKAKKVSMGNGVFRFTSKLTVAKFKTLVGNGYATDSGLAPSILLKDGNFTGVEVYDGGQLRDISVEGAPGNGGDGVHQRNGRSKLTNVSSFKHGQDGFKIGAYAGTASNTNLWRAENLIAESNGRHGCYISDDNNDWNCNAGLLVGYDASLNGGDGLAIGKAFANQFFGVCCQVNTGYGLHYLSGATGNYLSAPYTEANGSGDVCFDVGADQNYHLGVRPGVNHGNITNNGASNTIWNRNSRFDNVHQTTEHFKDIYLNPTTTSGRWHVGVEEVTRNLLLELSDTSAAAASVVLKSVGGGTIGLKLNDASGALQGMVARTLTLNFGSIAASSTKEQPLTILGADSTWTYEVNPIHAIPAGIMWSVYHDGTNIVVRCANVTGAAVTVNGGFRIVGQKVV